MPFSLCITEGDAHCQRDPGGHPEEGSQEQALQEAEVGDVQKEPNEDDTWRAVHLSTVQTEEGPTSKKVREC